MLTILLVLLSGCGFHLRGMLEMPSWLNPIAIVIQHAERELEPLLLEQLKAYHIRVSDDPAQSKVWLIIEDDGFQQQVGSISSSTTPRQYQLFYSIRFKLQYAKGREIIPSRKIIVTRKITINSNRILGSTNEEDLSKDEMRRDAVTQIMDQLSRAHEH